MRREISIEEISDGKLYSINDMVKADCQDCKGCSACCHGMGRSIVLDPLDVWNLKTNLHMSFEELMTQHIELNVVDQVILPNLKMDESSERCNFLDSNGRCSIHPFRPGICRIFPLGRIYEDQSFQYFLQVNECEKKNRTKVKVSKWIDCKHTKLNQKFIVDWHYFLKDVEQSILESDEENALKQVGMYVLHHFYVQSVEEVDVEVFYAQMEMRIREAREVLGI